MLAALNDLVGKLVHITNIARVLALRENHELVLDGQLSPTCARFAQGFNHRMHKGMHLVLIEAVEAIVKGAQGDGIEGEPRHVIGDVDDSFLAKTLPAHHHLFSDIEHRGEHIADGSRTKCRHEDMMCYRPVWLL